MDKRKIVTHAWFSILAGRLSENLENFLLMLADKYVPSLNQKLKFQEPATYPDMGIWHPLAPSMFEDVKEYLNWCHKFSS